MYFSYDPECGFDFHNTADEAKKQAESHLDDARDMACDGWPETTDQICWGEIRGQVTEVSRRQVEEDDCVPSGIDEIVVYELLPIYTQPKE